MRDTSNISQYRNRLDLTLSSHDLIHDDMLKTLVKNQILRSSDGHLKEYSDNIVNIRTKELTNFLSMLRSASVADGEKSESSEASHSGWKLKQDTEEIRVMYREGPEGTRYHTLLAEGYVDGPLDVCLCISWEVELYRKWWPQMTIPTFKIAACQCLQKIRIDEQICFVRMKLSRPFTAREAVVHLFAFEYFQDGLVVVVANSISNVDSVDISTHGFFKDGIPRAQDVVRIDLVGGFALQKVSDKRSYFRTIGNLDIKLDFVPPVVINFVSRQLVASAFKLFKKEVASVAKGEKDFNKALKDDPIYARIREALYVKKDEINLVEDNQRCPEPRVHRDNSVINFQEQEGDYEVRDINIRGEIEEIEDETCEKIERVNEDDRILKESCANQHVENPTTDRNVDISPEVKQALDTLEKAISITREYRYDIEIRTFSDATVSSLDVGALKDTKSYEDNEDRRNTGNFGRMIEQEFIETTSFERRNCSDSHASRRSSSSVCITEAHHNQIAPASTDEAYHIAACSSADQATEGTIMDSIWNGGDNVKVSPENGICRKKISERKRKLPRYCCLYFLSG